MICADKTQDAVKHGLWQQTYFQTVYFLRKKKRVISVDITCCIYIKITFPSGLWRLKKNTIFPASSSFNTNELVFILRINAVTPLQSAFLLFTFTLLSSDQPGVTRQADAPFASYQRKSLKMYFKQLSPALIINHKTEFSAHQRKDK